MSAAGHLMPNKECTCLLFVLSIVLHLSPPNVTRKLTVGSDAALYFQLYGNVHTHTCLQFPRVCTHSDTHSAPAAIHSLPRALSLQPDGQGDTHIKKEILTASNAD